VHYGAAGVYGAAAGIDRLVQFAATLTTALSSTGTADAGGTTAGVASQYGAVSLVVFVLAAVGILYLWVRLRRAA
jgi:hypothetical protein